jgi:hypothetical protein
MLLSMLQNTTTESLSQRKDSEPSDKPNDDPNDAPPRDRRGGAITTLVSASGMVGESPPPAAPQGNADRDTFTTTNRSELDQREGKDRQGPTTNAETAYREEDAVQKA